MGFAPWHVVVAPTLICAFVLVGCSGSSPGASRDPSAAPDHPVPPPPVAALGITTTSLPNGQVNHPYTATLAATGGQAPLSWAISSGALPAGLTLAASTGAISGTPTATAAMAALTFTVSAIADQVRVSGLHSRGVGFG